MVHLISVKVREFAECIRPASSAAEEINQSQSIRESHEGQVGRSANRDRNWDLKTVVNKADGFNENVDCDRNNKPE